MDLKNYQNLVLGMSSCHVLNSNNFVKNYLGPVLYFGRLREAKIVTISINPSDREFIDAKGEPLIDPKKRFETLASLGKTDWNGLTPSEYDKIVACCDNYFQNNPYTQWFDRLEKIINYSGYSYYDQKVSEEYDRAAHLDLFCWATQPKWGSLLKADQNNLMNQGLPVLAELLKATESPNLETIVLNGQTTIDWFNQKTGNSLQPTSKIFIRLSRKGVPQSVTCYEGTISQINGISLGRELKVVGWSCYVQNAFGTVTPGPNKI